MNLKKECIKKKVFLVLWIFFYILTCAGAIGVFLDKFDNAGYAVVPMVFALVFSVAYKNSKKAIEENEGI